MTYQPTQIIHYRLPGYATNHGETAMTEKFLRLPDVEIRVGLRRSAIYEAIKDNRFPKPVKLGIRAVAWAESEILS